MNVMNQWVLPVASVLPLWVSLSWGLLVSACVLHLRRSKPHARHLAVVTLLVTAMPSLHVAGYLALAFQTPSLVALAWALWVWRDALKGAKQRTALPFGVSCAGVLLGWALVLDTLNRWPAGLDMPLYALGFEAVALWGAMVGLLGLAWLSQTSGTWLWSALGVLAVFAATRWPTGNVWDALLDPFVWGALHVQLWQAWRAQRRQPA